MAYQAWSVVFGEQPSASKWNILGSNDASFNDGTGFGDGIVQAKHLDSTTIIKGTSGSDQSPVPVSYTDITGSSATFSVDVNSKILITFGTRVQHNASTQRSSVLALLVDGSTVDSCYSQSTVSAETHTMVSKTYYGSLTSGSHTVKLQGSASNSNVVAFYGAYWYGIITSQ